MASPIFTTEALIGSPSSSQACEKTDGFPSESAFSGSAVVACVLVAGALLLMLLILGTGLGLSLISPWAYKGASPSAIGASEILLITISQILASTVGGYIAVRSRYQWNGIHADEIYFRDTARRFLASALSSLMTAVIGSMVGKSGRIFMVSRNTAAVHPKYIRYLGQTAGQRTGLSQRHAEVRSTNLFATVQTKIRAAEGSARNAADKSRKASAYSALWLLVPLLMKALVANFAVRYGLRNRGTWSIN